MNFFIFLIRILFVLFLIYTVGFICHWMLGMFASLNRFSRFQERRSAARVALPDSAARQLPVCAIIPAHNEQDCIVDTVESLLREDYPRLEIIVVDDGSTDGTAALLTDRFGLREDASAPISQLHTKPVRRCFSTAIGDTRLVLVCKENGGKADALNCGLNFTQSPYCLILDADTQIDPGSVRIMVSQFLSNDKTIICAGAVRNSLYDTPRYRRLSPASKALVLFQMLEYYRTFYMQRILFNRFNANVIVSGAFAMFDCDLVKSVGGYRTHTIGEDMELTMRLHAFCRSQSRAYHISYAPEASCRTQVPFRYRDFFTQRRRWHIGMIQSLHRHAYMLGRRYYGWAGILAGTSMLVYELLAPIIELLGLVTIISGYCLHMVSLGFMLKAMGLYMMMILLCQMLFLWYLRLYRIEAMSPGKWLSLVGVSLAECVFFHPLSMLIKLKAFLTHRKHRGTWGQIQRTNEQK